MLWKKPIITETNLGLEINGYALVNNAVMVSEDDTMMKISPSCQSSTDKHAESVSTS